MSSNYWRGLPIERVPSSVIRAQYTHLRAAIDLERERIAAAQARIADASGEGSGEGIEPHGEALPDRGADRGKRREGFHLRQRLQVARIVGGNIWRNVLATPFFALRCAFGWHSWRHVRRLSFPTSGYMPDRWHSYDVCAHCRRINLASETYEPWRPSDADGE